MKLLLVALLSFLAYTTFAQFEVALDNNWDGIQGLSVKGRSGFLNKQKLLFGDYKTVEVDRSWTKGRESTEGFKVNTVGDEVWKIVTTDVVDKKQTLYFSLADNAGNQSKAFCVSQLHSEDFNIGENSMSALNILLNFKGKGMKSSDMFFANIFCKHSETAWQLIWDNQEANYHPKTYVGYLLREEEIYTITPIIRVRNKKGKEGDYPFGFAGFEIKDSVGQPVAAVSLVSRGVVYLQDIDPKERMLIATACAALLLKQELSTGN